MVPTLPFLLAQRYLLTHRLGAGGFGIVYQATDTPAGQPVAVKLLREEFAQDEHFVHRFRREAERAASIHDPHVVQIHDAGQEGGCLFIVMELVDGPNLKQHMQQNGPLPIAEACQIASDVLAGLAASHIAGCIHRDLKPQNVLLTREGKAKITDFGVARSAIDTGITRTGQVLGTAAYMAPEQAQKQPLDQKADLYAAGVILFEMLTGQLPFNGNDALAVLYQKVHDPPPSPKALNPSIPPWLEQVTLRALATKPDVRFQSALEMRQALTAGEKTVRIEPQTEATAGITTLVAPLSATEITQRTEGLSGAEIPTPHKQEALQAEPMASPAVLAQNTSSSAGSGMWLAAAAAMLVLLLGGGALALRSHPLSPSAASQLANILSTATPSPMPTATPIVATPLPPLPTATTQLQLPATPSSQPAAPAVVVNQLPPPEVSTVQPPSAGVSVSGQTLSKALQSDSFGWMPQGMAYKQVEMTGKGITHTYTFTVGPQEVVYVVGVTVSWENRVLGSPCAMVMLTPNHTFPNLTIIDGAWEEDSVSGVSYAQSVAERATVIAWQQHVQDACPIKTATDIPRWA